MHWIGLVGILVLFGCGSGTQTSSDKPLVTEEQRTASTKEEELLAAIDALKKEKGDLSAELQKHLKEKRQLISVAERFYQLPSYLLEQYIDDTLRLGEEDMKKFCSSYLELKKEVKDLIK